ncbi:hypothetical protein [Streptomyces gobiensis]|uniref:hypothetical protein n=1 Tax=Streptomyces gobiensis TaxID=2875706 RepID=UPI001E3FF8C5|nr:hypothetical protein [Streptomyces gobiensis]UGY92771.1 hypothetical protein test1122_14300 [Streptomyces gobiensis]
MPGAPPHWPVWLCNTPYKADDESEVRRALERLCAALELEPLGRPIQAPGRARWLARAVPADHGGEQRAGSRVSG